MLADARGVPAGDRLEADLCIIGAGAAGITLARELADAGTRVVMLEAGGLEFDPKTQSLYAGRSTGLPYFPLDVSRLRYFGGSTNHWGGVCRPFDPLDFEARDWIPHSGWPISRSDLDPYYGPAGEIVGLHSDLWSAEAWDRRDGTAPLPLGPRTTPRISQVVPTDDRSFATRYADEIKTAPDIRAYLRANVTEIETDATGSTATAVQVATLEGNRFAVTADRFVLATGGIENPRLLLASNRVQRNGLGNQHDVVGRFFAEHPRFSAAVAAPSRPELDVRFYAIHHVGDVEIQGYVSLPEEVQRSEEMTDVQVFVDPTYDPRFEAAFHSEDVDSLKALGKGEGDFRTNLMNVVGDLTTARDFTVPGAPIPVPYPEVVSEAVSDPDEIREHIPGLFGDIAADAYKRGSGSAPVDELAFTTRLDQVPNPDSRVTLSGTRDELGMPRARLEWRLTEIDRYSAARAIEILGAEFAHAGLGRVRATFDPDEPGWPEDLAGGNHHIGTTRMSDDPRNGVVDRNCLIHGMSNLYVAGSSVFTTSGSSTPTLTLVALALRLADHLRERR